MSSVAIYKALVGPLSLQHNFEVGIPNLPGANGFMIKFLATGVEIPQRDITAYEVWWRGRKGTMPATLSTAGELSLTLRIDSNWALYDQLYYAHSLVAVPEVGQIALWTAVAFSTNIKILNDLQIPIKRFQLVGCFLKTIGTIAKSHASEAEVDEVAITISYDDWFYYPTP